MEGRHPCGDRRELAREKGSSRKGRNEASPTSAKRRASDGHPRRNELAAFTLDRERVVGYGRCHGAPSVCQG